MKCPLFGPSILNNSKNIASSNIVMNELINLFRLIKFNYRNINYMKLFVLTNGTRPNINIIDLMNGYYY